MKSVKKHHSLIVPNATLYVFFFFIGKILSFALFMQSHFTAGNALIGSMYWMDIDTNNSLNKWIGYQPDMPH